MDAEATEARYQLLELARLYETVASLDVEPSPPAGRSRPGSRVPPGVQDILDDDEITRALEAVADWAEFCAHVLADERHTHAPDHAPARLRTVAEPDNVTHFLEHADQFLAIAWVDDLRDNLGRMRHLARRGVRPVRTRSACMDITCTGEYIAHPHGTEATEDLVCSACGDRVPWDVWHKWGSQSEWVNVEHAARLAGISVAAIKTRASRQKWRKTGTGRDVKYHISDVQPDTHASHMAHLDLVG